MDPLDRDAVASLAPLIDGSPLDARRSVRIVARLAASARRAGPRAALSGEWLTGVLLDSAENITIRTRRMLEDQYRCSGPELADTLVRNAQRSTAAIGAAMGALATAAEGTAVGLVSLPGPVIGDALLTAIVEMKLIAELHEAVGTPIEERGTRRALILARAWASGRGVNTDGLRLGGTALAFAGARREVVRLVRRRLIRRTGRSLSAVLPVLAGAAAAAQLNRRGTAKLARAVRADIDRYGRTSPDTHGRQQIRTDGHRFGRRR